MKKYRTDHDCLNCGATVQGKFCPECGQENIETREPFWSFLMHSIGHYFHFDSKFLKSIVPLITKPGKLTRDYISGKRASHFPPVTLYLFISLFFFLLISLNKPSVERSTPAAATKEKQVLMDSLSSKVKHSSKLTKGAKNLLATGIDSLEREMTDTTRIGENNKEMAIVVTGDTAKYRDAADYEQRQQLLPQQKRDHWLLAYYKKKSLSLTQQYGDKTGEVILETVQHQLPKMMFLLMPLFALILSITFYKSRLYFIDHLIYTLHVHSFLFLLYILLYLLGMLWKGGDAILTFTGLLAGIWYIYRSLRTVYAQGRWRTLFKFFLLGFTYLILLALCFVMVFAYSVVSL